MRAGSERIALEPAVPSIVQKVPSRSRVLATKVQLCFEHNVLLDTPTLNTVGDSVLLVLLDVAASTLIASHFNLETERDLKS